MRGCLRVHLAFFSCLTFPEREEKGGGEGEKTATAARQQLEAVVRISSFYNNNDRNNNKREDDGRAEKMNEIESRRTRARVALLLLEVLFAISVLSHR